MSPRFRAGWLSLAVLLVSFSAKTDLNGRNDSASRDYRERIENYITVHGQMILKEFVDLLSIPNVACDKVNTRRNSDKVLRMMQSRGIKTRLLELPGAPPVVFGFLEAPGATKTVVFYAHYDGQPITPADWKSDPWKPLVLEARIEDGGRELNWVAAPQLLSAKARIYARSSSDDKAAIVGLLSAIDALRGANRALWINAKFFFEGEEEAGSERLADFLTEYSDLLSSDLWIGCDGPVRQTGAQQVDFGNRGVAELSQGCFIANSVSSPALHVAANCKTTEKTQGGSS